MAPGAPTTSFTDLNSPTHLLQEPPPPTPAPQSMDSPILPLPALAEPTRKTLSSQQPPIPARFGQALLACPPKDPLHHLAGFAPLSHLLRVLPLPSPQGASPSFLTQPALWEHTRELLQSQDPMLATRIALALYTCPPEHLQQPPAPPRRLSPFPCP